MKQKKENYNKTIKRIYQIWFPTTCDNCHENIYRGQIVYYDMINKLQLCKKCIQKQRGNND